ncbi:AraC family transcriptional regulator [Streptococcus parauberis]|nr:AraC family transcriptional regulator [Streptococcus parauberis]
MMHQFNKTIDYLESTLTSEVDIKKFQNISGYSYPLFSRIFFDSIRNYIGRILEK